MSQVLFEFSARIWLRWAVREEKTRLILYFTEEGIPIRGSRHEHRTTIQDVWWFEKVGSSGYDFILGACAERRRRYQATQLAKLSEMLNWSGCVSVQE